jgi:hypothetical protein
MINFFSAGKHNFSKEACYIISSICYYGFATITIDEKSMIWIEAQRLEREGYIREYKRYLKSALFDEGDRFLSIPFYCCAMHENKKKEMNKIKS